MSFYLLLLDMHMHNYMINEYSIIDFKIALVFAHSWQISGCDFFLE